MDQQEENEIEEDDQREENDLTIGTTGTPKKKLLTLVLVEERQAIFISCVFDGAKPSNVQKLLCFVGKTHVDKEASYPILDRVRSSHCGFSSPPSLGHLCLTMVRKTRR